MPDAIAVLNAGSSSLKFSVFAERGDELELIVRGQAEGLYTAPRFVAKDAAGNVARAKSRGARASSSATTARSITWSRSCAASFAEHRLVGVGHRVVHGGSTTRSRSASTRRPRRRSRNSSRSRRCTSRTTWRRSGSLLERSPQLPQVACFDTAFHSGAPPVAQAFALPKAITDRGVRRYGFHGLSYEYIARVLPQLDERAARGKTVVLHLGNGVQHVRDRRRAAASPARWDSRRRTACRWARAAATSTPA